MISAALRIKAIIRSTFSCKCMWDIPSCIYQLETADRIAMSSIQMIRHAGAVVMQSPIATPANKPTPQEIEDVLFILRLGASDHEKWVIDYLIDKEEKE